MLVVSLLRADLNRQSYFGWLTENLCSVLHSTSPKWAPAGCEIMQMNRLREHLLKKTKEPAIMITNNRELSGGQNGRR